MILPVGRPTWSCVDQLGHVFPLPWLKWNGAAFILYDDTHHSQIDLLPFSKSVSSTFYLSMGGFVVSLYRFELDFSTTTLRCASARDSCGKPLDQTAPAKHADDRQLVTASICERVLSAHALRTALYRFIINRDESSRRKDHYIF